MLRAKDLWRQSEERKMQRMAAMRPVLAQLFSKIKTHAAQNPESPYMAFDVPTFVWGFPLYSVEDAISHLHEILSEQGYQVWTVPPKTLFISWMKPAKEDKKNSHGVSLPPRTEYRPFVYDDAAFSFLANKTDF